MPKYINFTSKRFRLLFMLYVAIIVLIIYACVRNKQANTEIVIDENPYEETYDADVASESVWLNDTVPDVVHFEEPTPEKKDRDEKIADVVSLWEMFFDDDNAPPSDWRRKNFEKYAYYLVNAVQMYQDGPTDIGGQLPKDRSTHLIAAQIVTKESALRSKVVGRLGEVGLMQVMPRGPTIAGHRPQRVRRDPELGIRLGVRWLAYSVGRCGGDLDEWSDDDWLGPMSFYSAGGKVRRRNGSCKVLDIARERFKKTLNYRQRMDIKKYQ